MPALRRSLRVSGRRLAAALLWGALLGGVFAMHGLSTHGVMGSPDSPIAVIDHAADAHAMPASHGAAPTSHPAPDGGHAETVMLCLAILAAAIILSWLAGFLHPRRAFTAEQLTHTFPPRPSTTHPPPLPRFVVMRC